MHSLSQHLRRFEAHGALPFHPDCPICRETRLAGTLYTADVVPLRAQAVVVAGVLGFGAVAPTGAAFAAEPDSQVEGGQEVSHGAPPDLARDPAFDPGGVDTSLPDDPASGDPAPVPTGSGEDDPVQPVTPQLPVASDAVVDPAGGSSDTAQESRTATRAPSRATDTPPEPAPAATPEPSPTAAVPPESSQPLVTRSDAPAAPSVAPAAAVSVTAPKPERRRSPKPARPARAEPVAQPGARAPRPPAVTAGASQALTVAESVPPGAISNDHARTVRPGESLWAIAAGVLGAGATPAQIAREVHRLWQLNRDRIRTGDPDLILAGTVLRLR